MIKSMHFLHNNIDRVYFYEKDHFKITTDNLSLSKFINVKYKDKTLVDFGTGIGIIPLLLSCSTNLKIFGIEKDKAASDIATSSVDKNNLDDKIKIINDDISNVRKYFDINSIDIVVCNPPYFNFANEKFISDSDYLRTAKHDFSLTMNDVAFYAKIILKDGGILFLVQRVENLFSISSILEKNNFVIKKIQFIYDNEFSNSKLVLIEASKNGKKYGLKVLNPMILRKVSDD